MTETLQLRGRFAGIDLDELVDERGGADLAVLGDVLGW